MSREKRKRFVFDAVYGEGTLQQAVYEDTAPVVTSVLDGYNVCIFAYGQTGVSMALCIVHWYWQLCPPQGWKTECCCQLSSIVRPWSWSQTGLPGTCNQQAVT